MRRSLVIALSLLAGCHSGPENPPPSMDISQAVNESNAIQPVSHQEPAQPEDTDGLSLAAQCIEAGKPHDAVIHLRRHVVAHPDQVMIRAYLAELLVKVGKAGEARGEFERFIADAQDQNGPARKHLVHCHTRLMEIAQEGEDEYTERLHRGIGLVLLAKYQGSQSTPSGSPLLEQMLCKAVLELRAAEKARPHEARPAWYLHEAFLLLGQRQSAEKALHVARSRSGLSGLTPCERRDLSMSQ